MNHAAGCSQRNFHSAAREAESAVARGLPRLVIRTCRHIKESGTFCRAAAVGGRGYCRAHLRLRVRRRKMARARRRARLLKLPPLMDMAAVQVGRSRVQVALEADHIDAGCARLLRWAMRLVGTNLRFAQQQQGQALRSCTASAKGLARSTTQRHKSKRLYQMQISSYDLISYNSNIS